MSRRRDDNVNPPHNFVHQESPATAKARLAQYHRANNSMEMFYDLYPEDRPPTRQPADRGRER